MIAPHAHSPLFAKPRRFASLAPMCALIATLGACGGKFQVDLDNQSSRTLYAGLLERSPAGVKVIENVTVPPSSSATMKVRGSTDEKKNAYSVMIGDSPSPRERGIVRRLQEGDNEFIVKQLSSDPKSPLIVELVED